MSNISFATFTRSPDNVRRYVHLIEGLIPNFFETIGCAHPSANAGIYKIEQKKPEDTLGCQPGQWLNDCASDVMSNNSEFLNTHRVHQGNHIPRMIRRPEF